MTGYCLFSEYVTEFECASVAFLDKKLFALQSQIAISLYPTPKEMNVYDASTFDALGTITIPALPGCRSDFVDMAVCCFYHCLYFAHAENTCIVRLKLPSELRKWKVDGIGYDAVISVTRSHELLVMCDQSNKLKLFSTDGLLRMTVDLQPDIVNVTSAVELIPGHYLVTHGEGSDELHRVCLVNIEGKILHAYGGFKGSYMLNCPKAVAVDQHGFVYVAEACSDRFIVLKPNLEYICYKRHDFRDVQRMKMDNVSRFMCISHIRPKSSYRKWVTVFQI